MILRWLDKTTLARRADRLTPEAFLGRCAGRGREARPSAVGNQDAELGDVFSVDADGRRDARPWRATCATSAGSAGGWSGGRSIVRGDAGPHLGAGMTGGTIEVHGDADDWAGAEMRGGLLRIRGNAGRFLGASYPGSRLGMRDGVILVDGDVGDEAGRRMRRGLIAVGGAAGDGFGRGMIAGSLFAFGPVGRFAGGDEAGDDRGCSAPTTRRAAPVVRPERAVPVPVPDGLPPAAGGLGFPGAGRGVVGRAGALQWRPRGRGPGEILVARAGSNES